MTDEPKDPQEFACIVMHAAAHFAGASLAIYLKSYPEHGNMFAQKMDGFAVRVSGIMTATPRVALVNSHDEVELDLLHVDLQVGVPPATLLN